MTRLLGPSDSAESQHVPSPLSHRSAPVTGFEELAIEGFGLSRRSRHERLPQASAPRAATNASTQRRTSSSECAADSCTRMRAFPRGTTGNENGMT